MLRANPERVYRAFLDADAKAKWLPPYGFTCKVHHMDAKVGGTYKMSFTNFTTGHGHSFGGEYRELVPFEQIRYTDRFDDPNLPGEMQTTVTLKQVSCGTELNVVQEGVPAGHSARDVLSRLARVARATCEARRTRDSGSNEVTPNPSLQTRTLLGLLPIIHPCVCFRTRAALPSGTPPAAHASANSQPWFGLNLRRRDFLGGGCGSR